MSPSEPTLAWGPTGVNEEYIRFLERCFREEMDFEGGPLRLQFIRRDRRGQKARSGPRPVKPLRKKKSEE